MDNVKLEKFNKLFPIYAGLSSDLLFWIAIDSLFLTVVKHFTSAQVVSLTSISLIVCIFLQVPILKIIKKIGNTSSVRLGSSLLFISSILLTFGTKYIVVVIGKIFSEIAFTFQNMSNAILKNNLDLQGKSNEYIKVKTKSNTVYAIVTMIIAFIASPMFNINHYLPMICCILFCGICFILSFYMIDFSNGENQSEKVKSSKMQYSRLIILLIVSYGLFFPIVNSGQSNGKLFIQEELFKIYSIEKTSLIIGAILCASRIIRVVSNIIFNKIHKIYKDKVGVILPILLSISIVLMISGYFISASMIAKFIVMSIGYIIILFIRDPFKVYIQDLALKSSRKDEQQTLLTTIELSRKIGRAIISLCFTLILVNHPMILVIFILLILSLIEILISLKLYKLVLLSKTI